MWATRATGSTAKRLATEHGPVDIRTPLARFPVITQAWLDRWEYVTLFLAFGPEVRRVIYTTNAIEALNRCAKRSRPRVISRPRTPPASCSTSRSSTPSRRGREPANWTTALLAFKIHFGDRLPTEPPTRLHSSTGHPPIALVGGRARRGHRHASSRHRSRGP